MSDRNVTLTAIFALNALSRSDLWDWIELARSHANPMSMWTRTARRVEGAFDEALLREVVFDDEWLVAFGWQESKAICAVDLQFRSSFRHGYHVLEFTSQGSAEFRAQIIERMISLPCFHVAFERDCEDQFWQNETQLEVYQQERRPTADLVLTAPPGFPSRLSVDINLNPGRRYFLDGFELECCWRMYLGRYPLESLGVRSIVNELDVSQWRFLNSKVLLVELAESPREALSELGRGRQRDLTLALDLKGQEDARVQNLTSEERSLEWDTGRFRNGATRRLIFWEESDGYLVPKRVDATRRRFVEVRGDYEKRWAGVERL